MLPRLAHARGIRSALATLTVLPASLLAAPVVRTSALGYETGAPKIAVAQDATGPGVTAFDLLDASKTVVYSGKPGAAQVVPGWKGMSFQTLDFSSVSDTGLFTLKISPSGVVSDTFRIGTARLFRTAGAAVVGYFKGMRNTEEGDREMGYFGQPARGTRDVYGGWSDALGDNGKYLSHLSYANFMNPQQIPMVLWSLLRSREFAGAQGAGIPFVEEALWGADYLLRVQDPAGYFYINVFNEGWSGARTICTWIGNAEKQGIPTSDYQAAWREGGGMSIAALALASRLGQDGDSSSARYLAGAKRGFAHLNGSYGKWADDGKENLIDHTVALLAATELAFAVPTDPVYPASAGARVDSILVRQTPQGWFWADGGSRVWYHGVDEGLPLVALVRYLDLDGTSERASRIRQALALSLGWYKTISTEVANPFGYPRMFVPATAPAAPGVGNQAKGKPAWSSTVQTSGNEAGKAFDGDAATRWSSNLQDSLGWIAVDLGAQYLVDSVSILWEAAHAKEYRIETSNDSVTWSLAATAGASGAGRVTTKLAARPSVRYVRMKGVKRSSPNYSYSIYEFEVYGKADVPPPVVLPGKTAFFMPHQNETGYWWQGENARLGSMTTAFVLASQAIDPRWRLSPADTVSRLAMGALEWVGGANPLGISFLDGFGPRNPPGYMGKTNIPGGIVNGITSSLEDETTPVFMPYENPADWKNWRWVEQWLPHDAWYLLATSSVANAQVRPIDVGVTPRVPSVRKLDVMRANGVLRVSSPGATEIELTALDGRRVAHVRAAHLTWQETTNTILIATAKGAGWSDSRLIAPLR
jgi:hypothetical protein